MGYFQCMHTCIVHNINRRSMQSPSIATYLFDSTTIQGKYHKHRTKRVHFYHTFFYHYRDVLVCMNCTFASSTTFLKFILTRVTRKQTLWSLSLSYQKKDGRAWPQPSFFWYDTDFLEFESFDFIDHIL